MDCFAVSIANGLKSKKINTANSFKIAFAFGFFQAFMPLIGWTIGSNLKTLISSFDHWLAFGLLLILGVRMILNSEKNEQDEDLIKNHTLVTQAVATSIDALIIGMSFAFLKYSILFPVIVIGIITFFLSLVGIHLGNKTGHFFEKKAGLIGGLILIIIGFKILVDHLFFT